MESIPPSQTGNPAPYPGIVEIGDVRGGVDVGADEGRHEGNGRGDDARFQGAFRLRRKTSTTTFQRVGSHHLATNQRRRVIFRFNSMLKMF